MEVYIAAPRVTLLAIANAITATFTEPGERDHFVDAECNGDWAQVHFNNEDMERPEMADTVLIEVEE